jgi:hypothetical protein
MATLSKTLRISPDSELGRALHEAATTGAAVQVDMGEDHYRIVVESPEQLGETGSARERPTPEQVALSIEGIEKAAGSWADIDAEAFKAYIRERRRNSSRPSVHFDTGS